MVVMQGDNLTEGKVIMEASDYISRDSFEWDGGRWAARTLAMLPEMVERTLMHGQYGQMFRDTARELSRGGTFTAVSARGTRTYTIVHADDKSRIYQRTGDAMRVRQDFPGR